jgi:putative endopeptidase
LGEIDRSVAVSGFEKKMKSILLPSTLVLFLVVNVSHAQTPPAERNLRSGVDPTGVDKSVRPQDDLFRHVNGGWIARTEIPPDHSAFGSAYVLRDNSEAAVRKIAEGLAAKTSEPAGSEARKIGDFYASFMDESKVESLGIKPIEADLARIDAIASKAEFLKLVAEFQRQGVIGLFRSEVMVDAKQSDRYIVTLIQSGIELPDESYYREPKFQPIRDKYLDHIERMLGLAGVPGPKSVAECVISIESKLAKHHWDRVKSRDRTRTYNKMTRDALGELSPGFGWARWFADYGAGGITEVVVAQPDYLQAMASILDEVPIYRWQDWLKWHVVKHAAPFLSKAFADADFEFFERTLTGSLEIRPRWKRAAAAVERGMGEAVGKRYVAEYFPPAAKARMKDLVSNLIEAYREDITNLEWMSPETRKRALEKLSKFTPKIGHPDEWRDYSKLEIRREDLVGNVRRAAAFEVDRRLAKVGKPVDRKEWGMTPQTVNAYYNPTMNEIVFPAAILQPPFFDMHVDDAVNYGAIGAVIGHEIGHGFDDQGSKFDGDGNMVNWWTAADRKEFEARAKKLIEQYNSFEPAQLPGQKVNGALTIGENIGDLGGLAIAYKAYRRSLKGRNAPAIDGKSGDERLFIGWAQAWRSKARDAFMAQMLATNPHSPPEFRCNGVVRNLPEFYATFGVKAGDKLWLPPERRVRIW